MNEEEKKETVNKGDSEKEKAGNKKMLILELVLAALAIIVIVVAIVINQKGNDKDSVSADAVDNSHYFAEVPEIPVLTQDDSIDYEGLAAEGKMLRIEGADGAYAYVHNYTNADYFKSETVVSENEVQDYIKQYVLMNYIEEIETDRDVAELYDTVSVNYVGTMDGVAFDGGSANDQVISIGLSSYIPGFTEGIIGMKVGETKDVPLTFPEDYGATELAGKDVVFSITLNQILNANKIPELTDAIAAEASNGQAATAEEMTQQVRDYFLEQKVWSFIDTDFFVSAVPEDEVMVYYDQSVDQLLADCTSNGADAEAYLNMYGISVEIFKTENMKTAVENVRHATLYNMIAGKEGVTVSDEDIARLAADYGYEGKIDEFKEAYSEETIRDYIMQSNLMDKFKEILK